VIQEQDDEHYMGYLVLQRINDNTSIIIDGQQRLTTVTLIIIAALYQLKELVEKNDHPEDNQRRLDGSAAQLHRRPQSRQSCAAPR
jgi:uncharacterized protein with ParB-like and HNH nuclease domain